MIPDVAPAPFAAMAAYSQWIVWQIQTRDGDEVKVPIDPLSGFPTNSQNPASWMAYADAARAANEVPGAGVGFVFTANDPFFFIDIDKALVNGEWSQQAIWARQQFPDATYELSYSGTGFHLFGQYTSVPEHKCKRSDLNFEFYTEGRFAAITFKDAQGKNYDWTAQLPTWCLQFPPDAPGEAIEWEGGPDPRWRGPTDDAELLRRMLKAKLSVRQAFGGGATNLQMYSADENALAAAFPPQKGDKIFDHSGADLSLCNALAFWTGKNCARMERMFSASPLGARDKWQNRPKYRRDTILRACKGTTEVYTDPRVAEDWPNVDRLVPTLGGNRALADGIGVEAISRTADDSIADQTPSTAADLTERERPCIQLNQRQGREVLDDMARAVVAKNEPPVLFRRAGRVVSVVRNDGDVGEVRILPPDSFLSVLSEAADFKGIDTRSQTMSARRPTKDLNAAVFAQLAAGRELPLLRAVSPTPILHEDGGLFDTEGYDPETRIYYAPKPEFKLGAVPIQPTHTDVQRAVAELCRPFCEMPFATEADWRNFLAVVLTSILRPWFPTVPFVVIEAPIQGSGKTLLAMAVRLIVEGSTGVGAAPESGKGGDAEWRKRITSILLRGTSVAIIDNVVGKLGGPTLSALATSPSLSDRLLGGNEAPDLPNTPTWIFTSNNAAVDTDLFRRCIFVRLDPNEAQPWRRTGFSIPDLLAYLEGNRGEYLAHVYTLARFWITQGKPAPPEGTPTLGSFSKWSLTIPGILGAAGVRGVMADLERRTHEMADPEEQEMADFLAAWWEDFAHLREGATARSLAEASLSVMTPALPWPSFARGRGDDAGSLARTLGMFLRYRKDRWYQSADDVSYRVRIAGGSRKKGLRWTVERRNPKVS